VRLRVAARVEAVKLSSPTRGGRREAVTRSGTSDVSRTGEAHRGRDVRAPGGPPADGPLLPAAGRRTRGLSSSGRSHGIDETRRGYLLWPYPLDALENQQRFTFGDVNPATYAARNGGGASKAPSASRATAIHRSRSSAVPARASAWIAVAYAIPLIHGVRPPP